MFKKKSFWIIVIFLCALLLRLAYLLQIKNNSPFFNTLLLDSQLYDNWAQKIASGDIIGKEPFWGLPLYPYLLALIYKIFGHNLFAPRLIQVIIGSVNCVLIFNIADGLFNRKTAVAGAILAVFYGPLLFFDGLLVSTTVAIFLYLCLFLILVDIQQEKPSAIKWILAGITLALAGLSMAGVALFVPFVCLWAILGFGKKAIGYIICLLLGLIIIIAPVTIRNYIVLKDFVPIVAHSGINFYIGNNEKADGTFYMPLPLRTDSMGLITDSIAYAERTELKKLKLSQASDFWMKKSFEYIKKNKTKWMRLLSRKLLVFFNKTELYDTENYDFSKRFAPILKLPFLTFGVIAPFAILGMFLGLRDFRKNALLYLFISSYVLSIVIFFINARYRLPVAALFLIFSGYAITRLCEAIFKKQPLTVAVAVAVVIASFFLVNLKLGQKDFAKAWSNLGDIYMKNGKMEQAKEAYLNAIKENSNYPKPYNDLGLIYFDAGDLQKAKESYKMALVLNPEFGLAHNNLGLLYLTEKKLNMAEQEFKDAVEYIPNLTQAHFNLGLAYMATERYNLAISSFGQALSLDYQNPKYHHFLALAYLKAGQVYAAKDHLVEALKINPNFTESKKLLEEISSQQTGGSYQ